MASALAKQIITLLETERQALKAGQFDVLDALAEQKAKLFDRLSDQTLSEPMLAQIRARLSENQALFLAAARGVAAARDRLIALQNVRENLSFYDRSGQMANVQSARPIVERKA